MTLALAVTIISVIWVIIIAALLVWFFVARARKRREDLAMHDFAEIPHEGFTSLGFDVDDEAHDETRPVDPLPAESRPPVVRTPPGRGGAPGANGEPFGLTTQEEYERLAAESFQAPPAAALGEQGRRAPFSWDEASAPAEEARAVDIPPVPMILPEPRSASGDGRSEEGDADAGLDRTVMVPQRRASEWVLVLPDGVRLPLDADVVIGRRPVAVEGSGVLQIPDPTRTLSKSHVRMRLRDGRWYVTDLASTNGLWLLHAPGVEEALQPHQEFPATPRMRFGTLTVELSRDEA